MKTHDDIKGKLAIASNILLGCNSKAMVLKTLNDLIESTDKLTDDPLVFCGQSKILLEIMDQISEVLEIIDTININFLSNTAKETTT